MPRKPRIEYYWAAGYVNWRLIGANGETMCQSTQGYQDKTDARRAVDRVHELFIDEWNGTRYAPKFREVGPGRKPAP